MPLAASSWSLSIGGSWARRTAPATDAVSRKHMMAIAKAPPSSASMWSTEGTIGHGQPGRDRRDHRHAVLVDRPDGDEDDAEDDGDERSRDGRERAGTGRAGGRWSPRTGPPSSSSTSPRSSMHAADLGEERRRRRITLDAEQLRELSGRHREPDADLDPGQGGVGDVVDERAEVQHARADEDHADEQRQHGEVASRVAAVRGDVGREQRRAGEDGDGRRRAHRQRPRSAEQGVHDHRHHARVEPDLRRQVGDRGVRHRLRDDDRSGRHPAEHVAAEP